MSALALSRVHVRRFPVRIELSGWVRRLVFLDLGVTGGGVGRGKWTFAPPPPEDHLISDTYGSIPPRKTT